MQQISQLLKKMFQKIYNPFRPDFYIVPSNGPNPLFSMIPQRQGASGNPPPSKPAADRVLSTHRNAPRAAARIRVTQKPVKDFLLFFTSVQKNVLSVSINRDGKAGRLIRFSRHVIPNAAAEKPLGWLSP